MNTNTTSTNFSKELSQRFLEAWKVGHGGDPDEVHVLVGDNSIALTIPRAMVKAETVLFNNTTNTRVLGQYLRGVLEMIADDMSSIVEDFSGREVKQIIPLIDLKAGWITAFYLFKEQAQDQHD